MPGMKSDAVAFSRKWANRGNENQDTQLFWIDLFQHVLGLDDAISHLEFERPVSTAASTHEGYIDVLIPSAKTLVEQKSLGIDLSKVETRQGRKVTPAQQGLAYAQGMPLSQQPRYIIACNFAEFWVYDRERDSLCREPIFRLALADLSKNLAAVQFLKGTGEAPETISQAVSVKAGKIMAQLHDLVAASFDDPDTPENHHALSVLMTRLMFLMFCEDAGLVEPNAFRDYVAHFQAGDLRHALKDLFVWLDTPDAERDRYAEDWLKRLPYMNGGLFRERTEIPPLSEAFRNTLIVEGCQEFDWSGVSPTVFGSIFEGALSHDHRRANGQHFTSPENIHKVIDPLFLDELKAEFAEACAKPVAGGARTRALKELHEKVGGISILDPAAGSGNFLTESYLCLRRLENNILLELQGAQNAFSFEELGDHDVLVSLRNFHGIELEDFACCVARTALWIAEKQADADTAKVTQRVYQELPLTDYEGIVNANALRIDWNDVVPASEVDYIIGNPPFIGQYNKTDAQIEDSKFVWGTDYDGYLDYATCWYRKAADYLADTDADFSFVSTNSICQGQPVSAMFKPLFSMGWSIRFAHRTFIWNSQADDEAHVHVVILGFSKHPKQLTTYTYTKNEVVVEHPDNINAYLLDAPNVFVEKRMRPLFEDIAPMLIGGKPADGGYFQIKTHEEYEEIAKDPIAIQYVLPSLGAQELINGKERWCLWLENTPPQQIAKSPILRQRVQGVRDFRAASKKAATRNLADEPWRYAEIRRSTGPFLCIPRHFSGERKYFTVKRCVNGEIATDACFFADDRDGLLFGIISSKIFMEWQKAVGGELKSDCRFSNTIVWNNFPLPELSQRERKAIINAGQSVILAREKYVGSSLADLYKPGDEFLYPKLYAAHAELDAAVEAAYGVDFNGDEEKIVAHLFKLYAEKTGEEGQ